jgi:hypothetical protein
MMLMEMELDIEVDDMMVVRLIVAVRKKLMRVKGKLESAYKRGMMVRQDIAVESRCWCPDGE